MHMAKKRHGERERMTREILEYIRISTINLIHE